MFAIVTVLAVFGASSWAMPVPQSTDSDVLTLVATGLLSQEKRLQAVEQQVANLQATGTAARLQNKDLSLETRVNYLEEDLNDFEFHSEEQLKIVKTHLQNMFALELEEIRKLHHELDSDVNILENKLDNNINTTDKIHTSVDTNTKHYQQLKSNLIALAYEARDDNGRIEDDISSLKDELKDVSNRVEKLEKDDEKKQPPQTGVGPLESTGVNGMNSQAKVSSFKEPLHPAGMSTGSSQQDESRAQIEAKLAFIMNNLKTK